MSQVVEDLLEALEDVDDATREEAAKALAELADPIALEPLLRACEDEFWSVRSHVACGVGKIGGPQAIEALVTLFNDPIMEVRNAAVAAMAHLGEVAVESLFKALKDERWRVREHAAKACGEIKNTRTVDALIVACRDRDGAVKSAAAEALGKMGDPKAIPALIKLFRDSSKTVRETAGTALVTIGAPSVDALIECLKDKDFVVRCHGARALGGMTNDYQYGRSWVKDPRVVVALIESLKDGVLRERAANALVLIGDAAIEPLISFLYDPKASEVESEGERVLSFASARLSAVDALRQLVLETLQKLGWEPPSEEEKVDSSQTDNLRVDLPLGDTGRFGPSGDLAKGAM